MTDPGMADHTYIEPLTVDRITAVIEKERPDALLPNLGGQTALNLASKLHEEGILKQYGVEVIGVDLEAIARGEDRIIFKETMDRIGVPVAKSEPVYSVEEAEKVAAELGYPVVLRPAYTMGGTGGGIVYNVEELRQVVPRGLAASPHQPGAGGRMCAGMGGTGTGSRPRRQGTKRLPFALLRTWIPWACTPETASAWLPC